MVAFMTTVISKIGEQHYNEGFDDCVRYYQNRKMLMPYDNPRDNYERGWNSAIKSIKESQVTNNKSLA